MMFSNLLQQQHFLWIKSWYLIYFSFSFSVEIIKVYFFLFFSSEWTFPRWCFIFVRVIASLLIFFFFSHSRYNGMASLVNEVPNPYFKYFCKYCRHFLASAAAVMSTTHNYQFQIRIVTSWTTLNVSWLYWTTSSPLCKGEKDGRCARSLTRIFLVKTVDWRETERGIGWRQCYQIWKYQEILNCDLLSESKEGLG